MVEVLFHGMMGGDDADCRGYGQTIQEFGMEGGIQLEYSQHCTLDYLMNLCCLQIAFVCMIAQDVRPDGCALLWSSSYIWISHSFGVCVIM